MSDNIGIDVISVRIVISFSSDNKYPILINFSLDWLRIGLTDTHTRVCTHTHLAVSETVVGNLCQKVWVPTESRKELMTFTQCTHTHHMFSCMFKCFFFFCFVAVCLYHRDINIKQYFYILIKTLLISSFN